MGCSPECLPAPLTLRHSPFAQPHRSLACCMARSGTDRQNGQARRSGADTMATDSLPSRAQGAPPPGLAGRKSSLAGGYGTGAAGGRSCVPTTPAEGSTLAGLMNLAAGGSRGTRGSLGAGGSGDRLIGGAMGNSGFLAPKYPQCRRMSNAAAASQHYHGPAAGAAGGALPLSPSRKGSCGSGYGGSAANHPAAYSTSSLAAGHTPAVRPLTPPRPLEQMLAERQLLPSAP
jgi:hypothetical protein